MASGEEDAHPPSLPPPLPPCPSHILQTNSSQPVIRSHPSGLQTLLSVDRIEGIADLSEDKGERAIGDHNNLAGSSDRYLEREMNRIRMIRGGSSARSSYLGSRSGSSRGNEKGGSLQSHEETRESSPDGEDAASELQRQRILIVEMKLEIRHLKGMSHNLPSIPGSLPIACEWIHGEVAHNDGGDEPPYRDQQDGGIVFLEEEDESQNGPLSVRRNDNGNPVEDGNSRIVLEREFQPSRRGSPLAQTSNLDNGTSSNDRGAQHGILSQHLPREIGINNLEQFPHLSNKEEMLRTRRNTQENGALAIQEASNRQVEGGDQEGMEGVQKTLQREKKFSWKDLIRSNKPIKSKKDKKRSIPAPER